MRPAMSLGWRLRRSISTLRKVPDEGRLDYFVACSPHGIAGAAVHILPVGRSNVHGNFGELAAMHDTR